MKRAYLAAAVALLATSAAASPFPGAEPVADGILGSERGGVLLPDGTDVSIGIRIDTRVDGALVLRTLVSSESPAPVVFAGGTDLADPAQPAGAQPMATPTVRFDMLGTTVTSQPTFALSGITVAMTTPEAPAGTPLPLTTNGAPASTPFGEVRLVNEGGGNQVLLDGPTLAVRHLIGTALGAVVANNADNRVIDSVTVINIELANVPTLAGISGLAVLDSIALDAAALRIAN